MSDDTFTRPDFLCKVLLLFWYAAFELLPSFRRKSYERAKVGRRREMKYISKFKRFFCSTAWCSASKSDVGAMCKASSMRFPNWCEWNWWWCGVYRRYNRLLLYSSQTTWLTYVCGTFCANVYSKKREQLSLCALCTHYMKSPLKEEILSTIISNQSLQSRSEMSVGMHNRVGHLKASLEFRLPFDIRLVTCCGKNDRFL